jgi:probable phosphoglycerate mutase
LTHRHHVFIARHGETDWNVAGRWQGHTDVPLNATGRAQAVALAERLRSEGIAAVATSDLSRARHTAEIVAGALRVPLALVDPDLREQRFGRFEGLTPDECAERYPEDWARYVADRHAGPPGGETRVALRERAGCLAFACRYRGSESAHFETATGLPALATKSGAPVAAR